MPRTSGSCPSPRERLARGRSSATVVATGLPVHFGVDAATRRCRPPRRTCQVWLAALGDKPSGARVQCQLVEGSIGTSHQSRRCIQNTCSEEHTLTQQFGTGVLAVHSILSSPPPMLLGQNGASGGCPPLRDSHLLLLTPSGVRCVPGPPFPQSS